jgi:hypothetical protein
MTVDASTPCLGGLTRGLRLVTLIAVLLLAGLIPATAGAEAASCQFVLGFKTLHDLIPSIVGNCATNEAYAVNGDATETTTNGLLVWRKADNHTAFTDGYRTWVNGPFGLQVRLNNARFPWEPDVAPSIFDPRWSASYQIAAASNASSLISNLVAQKIPVGVASLPGAWGATSVNPQTRAISVVIDPSLLGTDPHDAAAVLVHEATHAFNATHLADFGTSTGCFTSELQATRNDLAFWNQQFGPSGKQPATDQFELQENDLLQIEVANPQALVQTTFLTYLDECR